MLLYQVLGNIFIGPDGGSGKIALFACEMYYTARRER